MEDNSARFVKGAAVSTVEVAIFVVSKSRDGRASIFMMICFNIASGNWVFNRF
jgi:hypothetical protein